jgi:folate-dependent tRNA-U54 methylase TrmFO/GidA
LAEAGIKVRLSEMRGAGDMTPAHQTDGLAELVCSNSFRSDDADKNAVGLLHQEMRRSRFAHHGAGRTRQGARRIGAGGGSGGLFGQA